MKFSLASVVLAAGFASAAPSTTQTPVQVANVSYICTLSHPHLNISPLAHSHRNQTQLLPAPAPSLTTIQFDNLKGNPALSVNRIGTNGIYQSIFFRGFSLVNGTRLALTENLPVRRPGVIANTSPNSIAYAADDVVTIQDGSTALDTNYPKSAVTKIDLLKFYFGCVSATETVLTSVPISCEVSVRCNRKDKPTVGPQTFEFKRTALTQTNANMVAAEPKGFTGCKEVVFGLPHATEVIAGASDAATAGLLDTFSYRVY